MTNIKMGKWSAAITGASVLAFAISMIAGLITGSSFASYFASFFIAVGFVLFICSLCAVNEQEQRKALGFSAIAFAAIYAILIFLVYYAQMTTVRMDTALSRETLAVIGYEQLGSLFFNYDLLGYAFMALSTFFGSFMIQPACKSDIILKWLLRIHGIFFIACFMMPMFPVFTADTSPIIGTIILEIWCAYFLPITILGYRYFHNKSGLIGQGI